ncbi:MAG: hypothetical protein WCK92_09880 [Bacteroidota bacterium]
MKTKIFFGLLGFSVLALLLFTGCAHREIVTHCLQGHTYGFWGGLWHGLISPFDLIGMLIYDDVTVFAQNNNGAWYSFGFILGGGGWGLLGGNRLGRK